MTELDQYKKAYATLMGRVDEAAAKLLNETAKLSPRYENGLMLIVLELLFALCEAENIFLADGPEEE